MLMLRLALVTAAFVYQTVAAQDVPPAVVVEADPKALVRNADGEFQMLAPGDSLKAGDILAAPDRSSITLAVAEGSSIGVSEAAEVEGHEDDPAIESDLLQEEATADEILAALESGEDLEDVLEPTAAGGGNPIAGLSVFGWLANRFGIDTPELVSNVSASVPQTSSAVAPSAASAVSSALPARIRTQLLITRNYQLLEATQRYEIILQRLQENISERLRGGVSREVDMEVVKSWAMDAALEQSRANSRLLMSMDMHEDNFGYRIDSRSLFPQGWDSRHERSLDKELSYLDEAQAAPARRQWRTIEMERDSLEINLARLQHLNKVRSAYWNQFDLGQKSIEELIGVSRMYFDIEVQKIDTEYRLFDAQAQLLTMMSRLFEGDLAPAVETDHDA
jgi:hypothetical protein